MIPKYNLLPCDPKRNIKIYVRTFVRKKWL